MLTLSFGHTPRNGADPDDKRIIVCISCAKCDWSEVIYMADIFGSYAGVGDALWRVFNHWFGC